MPFELGGNTWHKVTKIDRVVSADLVTKAGAGGKPLKIKEALTAKPQNFIDKILLKESNRSGCSENRTLAMNLFEKLVFFSFAISKYLFITARAISLFVSSIMF